jgi:hypothetical protein
MRFGLLVSFLVAASLASLGAAETSTSTSAATNTLSNLRTDAAKTEASLQEKLLLAAIAPLLTAALAVLVGNRIAAYWAVRQKRREMALATANEFHRLYGEFFAVWKLWNHALDAKLPDLPKLTWELLTRSASAEGGVEAIFVKLSTERDLNNAQRAILGRFRQAYQRLRESIRVGKQLPWFSDSHPEYRAFKGLACQIGSILAATPTAPPTVKAAAESLRNITSNKWEDMWVDGV